MGINFTDLGPGSHTRLWEHFNNLKYAVNQWVDNPTYGLLAKTDGFQALAKSPSHTEITMASIIMSGGASFDSAHGGGIKVTTQGRYQVNVFGRFTGGAGWAGTVFPIRWRNGASDWMGPAATWKADSMDYSAQRTMLLDLQAGDILTVGAHSSAATGSTWGDVSQQGTTLHVAAIR